MLVKPESSTLLPQIAATPAGFANIAPAVKPLSNPAPTVAIASEQIFIACYAIAVTYRLAGAVEQISLRFAGRRTICIHLFILQVAALVVLEHGCVSAYDIFADEPAKPFKLNLIGFLSVHFTNNT